MAANDPGKLFICRTCVRDLRLAPGEQSAGSTLYAAVERAVEAAGARLPLRGTACLNGCPNPCNASVRGHGKALLRFSRLTPADAPALVRLALCYLAHRSGELAEAELPEGLREKLSARAPAFHPVR
jgi:predicted metal-binding protein